MNRILLPSGLFDLLPPQAQQENTIVHRLLSHFQQCGYAQVQPPLMEYESTLLPKSDASLAKKSFRVMDPLSQKNMALRADMTPQIARIASTALHQAPRPLRLCYAGQTVRTVPDALHSTRQFRQVGLELFGGDALSADVEMIQTAISAVDSLELGDLSLDIHMPVILDELLADIPSDQHEALIAAVRRKDSAAIAAFNHPTLTLLTTCVGEASGTLNKLLERSASEAITPSLHYVRSVVEQLTSRLGGHAPACTIDLLDPQGYDYYTGISFALYLKDPALRIGLGGRYISPGHDEEAVGFTLYVDDLLPVLPAPEQGSRLLLPAETSEATAGHWRRQGYTTIYALSDALETEARAQQCSHILRGDTPQAIS